MNHGGVDEWLKKAPEKKRRQIMQLSDLTTHTCGTCWWLQFKEDKSMRTCVYNDYNKDKLPYRKIGTACTWVCLGWRIDPEVRQRSQGALSIVM